MNQGTPHRLSAADLFQPKYLLMSGAGLVAAVALANRVVRFIYYHVVKFDFPHFWPISVFAPRWPDPLGFLTALGVGLLFFLCLLWLTRVRFALGPVLLTGLLLVLGSNLVQGVEFGLVIPISDSSELCAQYFHDAVKIQDPVAFLTHFEQIQSGLQVHGRTHPPGAVLLFYFFNKIFSSPGGIAVAIAAAAVSLSSVFFHALCRQEFQDREFAGYLTWLLLLIPAVQIYDLASLDAVIAALLTGALYFIRHPKPIPGVLGSVLLLFLASFLSFGALFIFPVMLGYEVWSRRSFGRSALTSLALVSLYLVLARTWHFNYLHSFLIASRLENPEGFRGFSEPLSYFFTRLEGISEIILFLGPFLGWLLLAGWQAMKQDRPRLFALTGLAAATLLVIFATGAFRTGETARTCLFIYPYLLFPVASGLAHERIGTKEKNLLLALVFLQSLLMQMFGFYFW